MSERPREIVDFDRLLDGPLEEFIAAANEIGEPLSDLAVQVADCFNKLRDFICNGIFHPEDSDVGQESETRLTTAVSSIVNAEILRTNPFANHFEAIKASILALGWISVRPAPMQFIRDMKDAGDFYGNRVLTTYKGNEIHLNFMRKWTVVLNELITFVRTHYTTGFVWATRAGGAPPPPPPPPPPPVEIVHDGGGDAGIRMALLRDLNRGRDVTLGLRPVDRDRPAGPRPVPSPQPGGPQAPIVHEPKFELEGKKWAIEYQRNKHDMVVENDDMSQSVSMFKCQDSSVVLKNKVNGVVIDNCKKCIIVLSSVISSVEVIRCDRLRIQCEGNVPLILIDSSESVQIFVTKSSRDVEIVSSKSASSNICLLEPDGDYKELPMPEQIKTVIRGDKLVSSVIDKY